MRGDLAQGRALRIAKVMVDALWWLGLAQGTIVAGWFLLAPVWIRWFGAVPRVAVNVAIDRDAALQTLLVASGNTLLALHPILENAQAQLEYQTTWGFQLLVNTPLLLAFGLALFGIHLVRSFLADVRAGKAFTSISAGRLTRLGGIIVAGGIAGALVADWQAWMIFRRVQLSGVSLAASSTPWLAVVLAGLLVLVLASAWRYGAELQQDRDLTV